MYNVGTRNNGTYNGAAALTAVLTNAESVTTGVAETEATTVILTDAEAIATGVSETESVTPVNVNPESVTVGVSETESVSASTSNSESVTTGVSEAESVLAATSDSEAVTTNVSQSETITSLPSDPENITIGVSETEAILATNTNNEAVTVGVSENEAVLAANTNAESVTTTVSEAETILATNADNEAITVGVSENESVSASITNPESVTVGISESDAVLTGSTDAEAISTSVVETDNIMAGVSDTEAVQTTVSETENIQAGVTDAESVSVGVSETESVQAIVTDNESVTVNKSQSESVMAEITDAENVHINVSQTEPLVVQVSDSENISIDVDDFIEAVRPETVYIGGVDMVYRVVRGSLNVSENVRGKPNTATISIMKRGSEPAPMCSQVMQAIDHLGKKLFEGYITSVDTLRSGYDGTGIYYYWPVNCGDYELLGHKHMFVGKFVNKTRGYILRAVFKAKAPDIDVSLVPDGPIIPSVSYDYLYPVEIAKSLCDFDGSTYKVNYDRQLIVSSADGNLCPITINDTSKNSESMTVAVDRTNLKNSIIVKGGMQAGPTITQTWIGDGVEGNFELSHKPFDPGPTVFIDDKFTGTVFDANKWIEYDINNPSPPPNHSSADGFIFPDRSTQTTKYSSMQVVSGGPGTYGQIGLISLELFPRHVPTKFVKSSFRISFISSAYGDITFGFTDGTGPGLSTVVHGIRIKGAGVISTMENGTETVVSQTYVDDAFTVYQVLIDLKPAGATYYIQGGAYGDANGPLWTQIADTSVNTTANLSIAILVASGACALYNLSLEIPPYNAMLTVSGVNSGKVLSVGYDPIDANLGVYAMLNSNDLRLRFFGDTPGPATIPAIGATITLSYTSGIPIVTQVDEPGSIALMASLDGTDGIWEGKVVDATISSMEEANMRGRAELDQFAYPEIKLTWNMPWGSYRWEDRPEAGQSIPVNTSGVNALFTVQVANINHLGNNQYALAIQAGSKIRGLADYLQALIADGKRFPQNNAQLEYMEVLRDTLKLVDVLTLTWMPPPPPPPSASGYNSRGYNSMSYNGAS